MAIRRIEFSDTTIPKLNLIKQLIKEVQDTFNRDKVVCDHCGAVKSQDQEQRVQWEMLEACNNRIDKVIHWVKS